MLQVKYLLGYNVPRANQLHKMLYSLVSGLHQLKWPELLMGLCWIALLLSIKRVAAHHRCLLFGCPSASVLVHSPDPCRHLHIVRCDDAVMLCYCYCCCCFYMHCCFALSHFFSPCDNCTKQQTLISGESHTSTKTKHVD